MPRDLLVHVLTTVLGGTGQLISRLTNDEIDLAMYVEWLAEFQRYLLHISQRANGCSDLRDCERVESVQACRELCRLTAKLVRIQGTADTSCEQTSSRAVVTGKSSSFNSIADLKDTKIGISRHGRWIGRPTLFDLRLISFQQR